MLVESFTNEHIVLRSQSTVDWNNVIANTADFAVIYFLFSFNFIVSKFLRPNEYNPRYEMLRITATNVVIISRSARTQFIALIWRGTFVIIVFDFYLQKTVRIEMVCRCTVSFEISRYNIRVQVRSCDNFRGCRDDLNNTHQR